jgi:SAM-dependent methyltransferase
MSETLKAHERRLQDGFYEDFIYPNTYGNERGSLHFGEKDQCLDIGFSGYSTGCSTFPNLGGVQGIDLDSIIDGVKYDGLHLPYPDNYWQIIYSSHMIEDVENPVEYIREHFRAVKKGGFLIYYLPHQWLYERKDNPPSKWNGCHNHFYTPAKFLGVIEEALDLRSYRVRRCQDCDDGYDYSIPDNQHAVGEYSIEVVLEKII